MKTYPYVCDKCGYFQWDRKSVCEGCGSTNTIRKTTKRDWKKFYLHQNIEKYTA
ncbi:MAG: zinc ribbon domain-containing protein [Promethearchaeota archaeon]